MQTRPKIVYVDPYEGKRRMFGRDGELYTASLFSMIKNANGDRRPDLISPMTQNPLLSMEVKTGRGRKGVLVEYQLHYAISTYQDYCDAFHVEPPIPNGHDKKLEFMHQNKAIRIAYYYNVLNRIDNLASVDLDVPFSTIQIQWGNHYIVPSEFGFYAFAIARSLSTGESIPSITKQLIEIMRQDIDDGIIDYPARKHKQSWKNLVGKDIFAIHQRDVDLTTEDGKRRLNLLQEHYPAVHDLMPLTIPGPNKSTIYALIEPQDQQLFGQLGKTVQRNRKMIEAVHQERQQAMPIIEWLRKKSRRTARPLESLLDDEVRTNLTRLTNWAKK